jgi:SOUL heme-binding protein
MTERQKYNILKRIDHVEIREYLPCVMADVLVESEYSQAGNIGFRPLVTYISQNNIAMTAPVIQEQKDEGLWWVSFVMPANMTLDQLPLPKNSKVSLRESPKYVAAVLSFQV